MLQDTNNWSRVLSPANRQLAIDDTTILLVGEIAECRYENQRYSFDPEADPTSSDRREVLGRLARLVPADYPAQDALRDQLVYRADALVDDNWTAISQVAEALLDSKTLDGPAVQALLASDPS